MLSKKLMVLLAAVVVTMLGSAVPAVAQNVPTPAKTTVYIPEQTVGRFHVPQGGGTLSCSGSPYTAPSGTCTPLGKGQIADGQVCDRPTIVTVFGSTQLSAFECHVPTSPTQFDLHDLASPDSSPTQDLTPAPNITLAGPKVTRS